MHPAEADPATTPDDLQSTARAYLQRVCDAEYDGNVAAMARAMDVSRSTLWKVLHGERGLNNLDEWEARLGRIGHTLRAAFGLQPDLPSRAARLVGMLPEHAQESTVQHLESMLRSIKTG